MTISADKKMERNEPRWSQLTRSLGMPRQEPRPKTFVVEDLHMGSYQRHQVPRLVTAIGADFDFILAGVIVVSLRDGIYYVVDGQQRVSGARIAGVKALAGLLVEGLSEAQEAGLFRRLNEARVAVSAVHKFNAAYIEGTDWAIQITRIVEEAGGKIDVVHGQSDLNIRAVATLRQIFYREGSEGLAWVLRVVGEAWGEVTSGTAEGRVLAGLVYFYAAHRDSINTDRLIGELAKLDPATLNRTARGLTEISSNSTGQIAMYKALVKTYNATRRGRKLEPVGRVFYAMEKAHREDDEVET